MNFKFFLSVILCFFIISCSTLKPTAFSNTTVKTDPVKFFVERTQSYGVTEARNGKPASQITTQTEGIIKDGVVFIEQELQTGNGKKNHRSWQLKQVDEHHLEATANDIEGTARGELNGNYFTWTFRLKVNR